MVYCLNLDCLEQQDSTATNFCRDCGSPLTLEGRYRAQSAIGESGFGRTLVATDKRGARYVIKQIYRRSDSFEQDALRLKKLGAHAQIPALIEAIDNELGQFLIQEFIEGENLQRRVERKGPLDEEDVRSLLKSLLSVVEFIHSFKIIHRDIKPLNIILTEDNLPVLVDLGAAKLLRASPAKTVLGSADYAAPEQSMGKATFASDLYSLGVTCLYALTSVAPFTLYSAAEDRWVWQEYLSETVDSQFAAALDKMVAQSLQNRFETAQQVAAALDKNSLSFLSNVIPKGFSPEKVVPNGWVERVKKSAAPIADALQKQAAKPALRPAVTHSQQWQQQYQIACEGGVSAIALPSSLQPFVFAVADTKGSIHLHNLQDGQRVHTFSRRRFFGDGHSALITALHFHGRVLYSASEDGTIKEWDSIECRLLNTIPAQGWIPTDLKVTADGSQLVSSNSDGRIVVWSVATLLPIAQLVQHQGRVNAIALSSDALASASEDGTVKLWHLVREEQNKLRLANTIKTETGAKFLSFHERGSRKHLVVAFKDKAIRYELDAQLNERDSYTIHVSSYPITAFSLSSEGYLLLGSGDRFVTVWDVDSGECVAELAHGWGVVAIAASQSSQTVGTASADEVVTIWNQY